MKKSASKGKTARCACPFCEGPVTLEALVCESCHVSLRTCPSCKKVVAKKADKCPTCGARLA